MYQMVATNLELNRKKGDTKAMTPDRKLKEGGLILIKDHMVDVGNPRYSADFEIVSFPRKT